MQAFTGLEGKTQIRDGLLRHGDTASGLRPHARESLAGRSSGLPPLALSRLAQAPGPGPARPPSALRQYGDEEPAGLLRQEAAAPGPAGRRARQIRRCRAPRRPPGLDGGGKGELERAGAARPLPPGRPARARPASAGPPPPPPRGAEPASAGGLLTPPRHARGGMGREANGPAARLRAAPASRRTHPRSLTRG